MGHLRPTWEGEWWLRGLGLREYVRKASQTEALRCEQVMQSSDMGRSEMRISYMWVNVADSENMRRCCLPQRSQNIIEMRYKRVVTLKGSVTERYTKGNNITCGDVREGYGGIGITRGYTRQGARL